MGDPQVAMELLEMGIDMEKGKVKTPKELNRDKTLQLVKEANIYAFDLFKKDYSD